ncbi:hypothetical protein BpHYR1_048580 [Brachionus plicatilis]|uniref:Uncharacterized protein n=1 Tax=Brachionus plicatilis TaxID=10195 RepID=A0A3M7S2L3_BRAPC|nr:hypothetical protein BpHYR1_048580 [Brachionus plicatilis]
MRLVSCNMLLSHKVEKVNDEDIKQNKLFRTPVMHRPAYGSFIVGINIRLHCRNDYFSRRKPEHKQNDNHNANGQITFFLICTVPGSFHGLDQADLTYCCRFLSFPQPSPVIRPLLYQTNKIIIVYFSFHFSDAK